MHEFDTVCRMPPRRAAVSLRGISGVLHGFTAFPLCEAPCGPAVYIFARPVAGGNAGASSCWALLSMGETAGGKDRIGRRRCRDARIVEGNALGATHILIHFCHHDADRRRMIFDDLSRQLAGTHELNSAPQCAA